jgi:nitric oxide reductase subunit B
MKNIRLLWILLAVVVLSSFAVLPWFGRVVYRQSPPILEKVVVGGSGTTSEYP